MGFVRCTLCFVIILSMSVGPGELGAASGATAVYRAQNSNSSNGNYAGSSSSSNNNTTKPPIVASCGCNSSDVSFRAMSWDGQRARMVVANQCRYGMGDVLVSCVGWKQEFVEDESVLGVARDSKSCVLFPGGVLQGGVQYSFYVNGAPLSILFDLEPVELAVEYFCYDCTRCSNCCRH